MPLTREQLNEHMLCHPLEQASDLKPPQLLEDAAFRPTVNSRMTLQTQWRWPDTEAYRGMSDRLAGLWDLIQRRIKAEMRPYHYKGITRYPTRAENNVWPEFVGYDNLRKKALSIAGDYFDSASVDDVVRSMMLYSHLEHLLETYDQGVQPRWCFANSDMVEHMLMLVSNGASAHVVQGVSISAHHYDRVITCSQAVQLDMKSHQWVLLPWNNGDHWGGFFYHHGLRTVFYSDSVWGGGPDQPLYVERLCYNFLRFLDANDLGVPQHWKNLHVPVQQDSWGSGYHTAMACHALLRQGSGDWHQFFRGGDMERGMLEGWRNMALALIHPSGEGYCYAADNGHGHDRLTQSRRRKREFSKLVATCGIDPVEVRLDVARAYPIGTAHPWHIGKLEEEVHTVGEQDNS
ncbi:hypothetical protein G7054_g6658 [Neopestalotiopsis clavispora]|nr:hypothetical protein G7054_g6658 [Neopestalotiopsis clavispora]